MEMEISWEPGKNVSDFIVIRVAKIRVHLQSSTKLS